MTKSAGPRQLSGGFQVDPEQVPGLRAAFEDAIAEMTAARRSMEAMRYLAGTSVNPVVDKYNAAVAEVGYGDSGSVTMAADSAVAEYQNVVDQLDQIMAGYASHEEAITDWLGRLRS